MLGASTASVAGLVNVCSVMAFFAFASNVTGHVAIFAEELVKGHLHQITVVGVWLGLFLFGAMTAHACAYQEQERAPHWRRGAIPLVVEALLLAAVGYYGTTHYRETLKETEVLVGILLFAMGLQNGLVATVSGGVVKTTHLTGLMTDLGMEIAALLRPGDHKSETLRFKATLHAIILGFYIAGGIGGGILYNQIGFSAFYVGGVMLAGILVHEFLRTRVSSQLLPQRVH